MSAEQTGREMQARDLRRARIESLLDLHKSYMAMFLAPGSELARRDLAVRGFKARVMYEPGAARPAEQLIFREGRRSFLLHIEYMTDPANFTDEALSRFDLKEGGDND